MTKKKSKKKELESVDVHDRELMVSLGLHPRDRIIPDFSKTDKEKQEVKEARRRYGRGFYNQTWTSHDKPVIPVYGKLILYVYKEPVRSISCNQSDISEILYNIKSDPSRKIIKYQWNGRTYQANELPAWRFKIKSGKAIPV